MKIEPMPEGTGALISRMAADDRKAASELATPVTAGPVPVVAAVATGSLPAESVQLLIVKWLERCEAYADKSDLRAHPTWTCLCDLRAEMGRANRRQPEENVPISHDRERRT